MEREAQSLILHGVRLDRLDFNGALSRIARALEGESSVSVFTPNAEMIYRAARERRLAGLLNSGDINVADGIGVLWAARRLRAPLPGRIAGIELGETAIAAAASRGGRVYLLGGARGIAERAADNLVGRYPSLIVAGVHHGYFNRFSSQNAEVCRSINDAAPELLIVCMGYPRQEEWIVRNRASLPSVRVFMALGGSLDVWSGAVQRAPALFRRAGLEWLWRILRAPSRLVRAGALPGFALLTLREKRRLRASRRPEKQNDAARGRAD